MDSDKVIKHLRVLWRTDRIIAEIRMRHMLTSLGLRAFAALIAAFGLLMLELAAYFALIQIWNAIAAAAALGAVNFVIAGLLLAIASRSPSGRELELAGEIHGASMEALQVEARGLQAHVSSMMQHPLNSVLPLMIPLIAIIVKSLRHPARPAAAEGTATPAAKDQT